MNKEMSKVELFKLLLKAGDELDARGWHKLTLRLQAGDPAVRGYRRRASDTSEIPPKGS